MNKPYQTLTLLLSLVAALTASGQTPQMLPEPTRLFRNGATATTNDKAWLRALIGLDTGNSPAFANVTASTFTGSLVGNASTATTANGVASGSVTTTGILDGTILNSDINAGAGIAVNKLAPLPATLGMAASDLTTAITVGNGKAYLDIPFSCTLTEIIVTALTAPTGSVATFDVNKNGTTVMATTKVTLDATETSSLTAAIPAVITTTTLAKGDRITVDFDGVGSTAAGTGIVVWLNVTRN